MNILERIESRIIEQRDGECWITTYKTTEDNPYPRTTINGTVKKLMHIVWEAYNAEPMPKNMDLCHTCDNPACINPEHLVPGTHAENMAQCAARGRKTHTSLYSLSEDDYDAIFHDDRPTSVIAKAYGVSTGHIRRIRRTGSGKQPAA